MPQNDAELWEEIFTIVTILIFALIGSFLKGYISKVIDQRKFKLSEVFISTIMSTLISYYIAYPLCKRYELGVKALTGIIILIGFLGYNLTETILKIVKEIHTLKPKGIIIAIIGFLLKLIGLNINIKELIEEHRKNPTSDVHDNHYTTINNTYIQTDNHSKTNK